MNETPPATEWLKELDALLTTFEYAVLGVTTTYGTIDTANKARAAVLAHGAARPVAAPLTLSRLDELAKVYATSYASPHHFTMSVEGLRALLAEASQPAPTSGVAAPAPCAGTYAGCAPECGPHNRCTDGVPATDETGPMVAMDEDDQHMLDLTADLLERYIAFIKTVPSADLEAHPYLPEVEMVAAEVREFAARATVAAHQGEAPDAGVDLPDGAQR